MIQTTTRPIWSRIPMFCPINSPPANNPPLSMHSNVVATTPVVSSPNRVSSPPKSGFNPLHPHHPVTSRLQQQEHPLPLIHRPFVLHPAPSPVPSPHPRPVHMHCLQCHHPFSLTMSPLLAPCPLNMNPHPLHCPLPPLSNQSHHIHPQIGMNLDLKQTLIPQRTLKWAL